MNSVTVKLSFDVLRKRAEALVPRFRERARQAELDRRVPDESVQELQAAGLFEIQKPSRFGGAELGLTEFVEIAALLGRGCGSTAWVYSVTAERAWLLAKFSALAQEEVWGANPQALITSSITPNGQAEEAYGGCRITGHWRFVSGIDIAEWAVFCSFRNGASKADPLPIVPVYVLVPKSDCEVIDTWHVAGLSATASHDVKLNNIFVPEHRIVRMLDLKEGGGPGLALNTAPLYKLPLIAINPYAILAPILGIAEGALEQTLETSKARRLVANGVVVETQSVQLRIAEAASEIAAARALILSDCREAMAAVEEGAQLTIEQRLRLRRNQAYTTRLLVSAVDHLFVVSGGRGIYLDHFMQRSFRDMHAAGAHLGLSWDLAGTLWGQHALGLPVVSAAY